MEGAGAHLHVVGLQDHAALIRPVALQRQDQALERALGAHVGGKIVASWGSGRSRWRHRKPASADLQGVKVRGLDLGRNPEGQERGGGSHAGMAR